MLLGRFVLRYGGHSLLYCVLPRDPLGIVFLARVPLGTPFGWSPASHRTLSETPFGRSPVGHALRPESCRTRRSTGASLGALIF